MRISGLSIAAVLLLSSVAFAQHHDAPSAPPPPPPPPAAAPSPAPILTPSAPAAPAPESHASAPSAPSSPGPAPAAHPEASSTRNNPGPAPEARAPEANRVVPDQKIVSEEKIESAPRVGEDTGPEPRAKDTPEKAKGAKADPDLRRHICGDKPCQSPEPKPVEDKESKRRPCEKEPCPCPPGEHRSGGGCVATVVQNNGQCGAGEFWNGASCITRTCPPNEVWNGTRCTTQDDCAAIEGSAANLIAQLRALRTKMQGTCAAVPSSDDCMDLTQQHDSFREQYRALWNQGSPLCRGRLPDPDAL